MVKHGSILIECIQNLVRTLAMSNWDYAHMGLVLLVNLGRLALVDDYMFDLDSLHGRKHPFFI